MDDQSKSAQLNFPASQQAVYLQRLSERFCTDSFNFVFTQTECVHGLIDLHRRDQQKVRIASVLHPPTTRTFSASDRYIKPATPKPVPARFSTRTDLFI